jgi:50S ribosomal protein L16 3-hydroxylase
LLEDRIEQQIDLTNFFGSLNVNEFLRDFWPDQKPYIFHGALDRLSIFGKDTELSSVDRILDTQPEDIRLWFRDSKGVGQRVPVNSEQARSLFKTEKVTLSIDRASSSCPTLALLSRSVEAILGVPPVCNLYISPKGNGTEAHFDNHEVINLHIKGKKRWWYAPNPAVEYPNVGYSIAGGLPPWLASIAKEQIPNKMPDGALSTVMEPGSLLFLPRGYYHATEALEDCIAVTFAFPSTTVADFVLRSLTSKLCKNSFMGQSAAQLAGPGRQALTLAILRAATDILNAIEPAEFFDIDRPWRPL